MATFFSPKSILTHLQEFIPRLSDRFSNNITVIGEIVAGTPQVLKITEALHGKSPGDQVVLIDGTISNAITAVELIQDTAGDVLRFTTGSEHDLTKDYVSDVELSGFTDPQFNGVHLLVDVPSRTLFEIPSTVLPTLNGNEVLQENWELGINGLFTIARVPDASTYEIDLTGKPTFTPQTVPTLRRAKGMNMMITIDAERAKSMYTKQPNNESLWLFVIMGEAAASKDRRINSDANQTNTPQNPQRILMVNSFTLLVIFPTVQDTSGAVASDLSWDEILKLMYAVASGIRFDDFGNTRYLTTMIDHGTSVYDNATYSHAYTFEYNYEVTQDQTSLTKFIESRAFRDDAIAFNELEEGSEIDLDGDGT